MKMHEHTKEFREMMKLKQTSRAAFYSLCYGASEKRTRKIIDHDQRRMPGRKRAAIFKRMVGYLSNSVMIHDEAGIELPAKR